MAGTILVTGATGTLGRHVVTAASTAGHDVRGLSRCRRADDAGISWHQADLVTGDDLDAAVHGVDAVIHCATQATGSKDVVACTNLLAAARRQNVGHVVYISIVGVDRIPLPYYRHKLSTEEVLAASGVGHTILRATQFHDLIARLFDVQRRLPVLAALRGFSFQPINTTDVAARLLACVDDGPAGRAPDIGGPAVHSHAELARIYLNARHRRRRVISVPVPGKIGAGYRSGANLAADNPVGTRTFADFLAVG